MKVQFEIKGDLDLPEQDQPDESWECGCFYCRRGWLFFTSLAIDVVLVVLLTVSLLT